MKSLRIASIVILFSFLGACGDSDFRAGSNPDSPPNVNSPITPFEDGEKPTNEVVTDHCQNVIQNAQSTQGGANVFYGDMNVGGRGPYQSLMEVHQICNTSGWRSFNSVNFVGGQYNVLLGTADCDFWDQKMSLWLGFSTGSRDRVGIAIDTTGDGYPLGQGQGFATERMQLEGVIDCTKEDLTINALAYNQSLHRAGYSNYFGYLTIVVDNSSGHKNYHGMRASIYFKDQRIGTTYLAIQ